MTIAIVLAAGKGTRMCSSLPKVGHRLAGKPLIEHVHETLMKLGDCVPLYVLGHQADVVREMLPDDVQVVLQETQRGTGHAVAIAAECLPAHCDEVLIVYGDMPLLTPATLAALREQHRRSSARLTLLAVDLPDPQGYGRVIRDQSGRPLAIVEQKWLTAEQVTISEVNTGLYVIDAAWLRQSLPALPQHDDGEIYLTDLAEIAASQGALDVAQGGSAEEVLGINDRVGLAAAERVMRRRINERLMRSGVTLIDPDSTYIAVDATIGIDTVIEPNVWIDVGVTIGERCRIGSNSRVIATAIGHDCKIDSSVIEYAELEPHVTIGPFSHLRAGTVLSEGVHVGNFAEIKNSTLGPGTHMGHFSYVGDASVGVHVNIGAGTVTANYDGRIKHRTTIGDRVSVGVGTMLRAPVVLGADSKTGAGSVVLHDVPPNTTVAGVPARSLHESSDDRTDNPE